MKRVRVLFDHEFNNTTLTVVCKDVGITENDNGSWTLEFEDAIYWDREGIQGDGVLERFVGDNVLEIEVTEHPDVEGSLYLVPVTTSGA